jgi:phage terminase Nu1 subunit (DNA packaging protein)
MGQSTPASALAKVPANTIAVRGDQLAAMLNVSVRTLTNWRQHNGLPSVLIGGTRLYVVADVMNWLDRQGVQDAQRQAA